ncbi:MAG: hypothetical protein JST00_48010 [Deltaproteobacteria bacterium]|nr:hypothetical protein [Deltaproteobacteria bacterium]
MTTNKEECDGFVLSTPGSELVDALDRLELGRMVATLSDRLDAASDNRANDAGPSAQTLRTCIQPASA